MRAAVALAALLVLAAPAQAAPPLVAASAAPAAGIAPLRVTLTATGDAAGYSWDLGDGTTASGPAVSHVYAAGRYTATVTATSAEGEVAQAQVAVSAVAQTLALVAPRSAAYGDGIVLRGTLAPARAGVPVQIYRGKTYVTSARTRAGGAFRASILVRSPGPYQARYGASRSAVRTILLRPRLELSLASTAPVGGALELRARLTPAGAGSLRARVLRGSRVVAGGRGAGALRLKLPTSVAGGLRVEVVASARPGFATTRRTAATQIVLPSLGPGSTGPSVLALERRLRELRYALRGVDASYGQDTTEAVLAFQKVHGLPRTGSVEAWLWRRLATATVPEARFGPGNRIEVDKSRQVLFEIQGGKVVRIVHVSTGATGNTPLGTWQVYRKVPGFDWVLYYPMYFLRGFAIHGYPSVPAYPASHGCVRIPMWIAPVLYAAHAHGATITIYA